jgi:peptide deformylase
LNADAIELVFYPDPILRKKAAPITEITEDLVKVTQRMIEIMHESKGVGLAGPQVGIPHRFFVMNPSAEPGDEVVVLNPLITRRGKKKERSNEGCLSLPDINGKVERPTEITLTYYDLEGDEVSKELDGFAARVAQHEFDHLDGILIIDRMSPAERAVADRRLRDLIHRRERERAREAAARSKTPS